MGEAHRLWLKVAGTLVLLVGSAALYYGFVMTFLVPGNLGESFFQRNRVLLGMLPLCAGFLELCWAGWLFFRSVPYPKRHLLDMIVYCIGGAIGAIWVFLILGALYQRAEGF
jgi:hypothetical protein